MYSKFLPIIAVFFCSAGTLFANVASADVPLTQAVVQNFRNQVRLLLKNQNPRQVRVADKMTPGDALATARSSLVELRFNDSSLARIGEQALFRFLPNTRTFQLGNGTALLLIPPGRGTTRVRTPNAAAGIRGSALFVRYSPDTDTTIVGALTNSQIEVFNNPECQPLQNAEPNDALTDSQPEVPKPGCQRQPLQAGQLAVVVQNRIERIYNFDLNTFYETSELVRGLDLPQRNALANPDPAIAAVQAETAEAIRQQTPIVGQNIIDNPTFIRLATGGSAAVLMNPTAVQTDFTYNLTSRLAPLTEPMATLQRSSNSNPTQTEYHQQPKDSTQPVATVQPPQSPVESSRPNPSTSLGVQPPVVAAPASPPTIATPVIATPTPVVAAPVIPVVVSAPVPPPTIATPVIATPVIATPAPVVAAPAIPIVQPPVVVAPTAPPTIAAPVVTQPNVPAIPVTAIVNPVIRVNVNPPVASPINVPVVPSAPVPVTPTIQPPTSTVVEVIQPNLPQSIPSPKPIPGISPPTGISEVANPGQGRQLIVPSSP
jgi:hypothetical protein